MEETDFKRAEFEDAEIISHYFKHHTSRSCERTFVNVFLWSRRYPVKWAVVEGALVFKSEDETQLGFAFPAGPDDCIIRAIGVMKEYSEKKGKPFFMYNLTPDNFAKLEQWFPGRFQIRYDRDAADYIYETEKLATLAGRKLHGKRNHVNKFKTLYDGRWSYEEMCEANIGDCIEMALEWRKENGCDEDEEKQAEFCVTLNALRLFDRLGLDGGVLKVDGKVVAFTIGEPVCSDTYVVHIEKAFADVPGAYSMINQQFVAHTCMDYAYVNREDDAGEDGLRQAKLSYHPFFLVEKGDVTEI